MTGKIGGRYEIRGEIGRGGFATVYRAYDPLLGREVAVKVLTGGPDPDLMARFRTEAGTTASLHHRNIVSIYDFGEQNGQPFLVMELISGRELSELIRAKPPLSLLEKLEILGQVAHALAHAHQHGVIHRDVKPGNILVQAEGTVKVMDFGIAYVARSAVRHTMAGYVVGTMSYIAPEQLKGATVDARSDIFSFGVLAYELLTGKNPFTAADAAATMYRVMQVDPPPLQQVLPGCPSELQGIVQRALAKDRDERAPSLSELVADLEAVRDDLRSATSENLTKAAEGLVASGSLDKAQTAIRQALELRPNNTRARELRTLLEQGLREKSRSTRERQVTDVPVKPRSLPPAPAPALPAPAAETRAREWTALSEAGPALPVPGFDTIAPYASARLLLRRILSDKVLWWAFGVIAIVIAALSAAWSAGPLTGFLVTAIAGAGAYYAVLYYRRDLVASGQPNPAAADAAAYATVIQPIPVTGMMKVPEPVKNMQSSADPNVHHRPEATQMFTIDAGRTPMPEVYVAFQSAPDRMLTGRPVRIRTVPFHIGRAGPELAIPGDPGLSRNHAVINWSDGMFTITDLGSSNGTLLDRRQLLPGVPEKLIFGNTIRLSAITVLTFTPGDLAELPDLSGTVVAERYQLNVPIRVGLKSLYEAQDLRLGKHVAIKLLSPGLARYPGYLEQFRHEAQTAARLTHPHICPILDHGDAVINVPGGGDVTVAYIASVMLGGGSLERKLAAGEHLSKEAALECLEEISDALDHAHSEGVLHGNLKPASVIFDTNGRAYLTDFALGSAAAEKGRRSFLGTPEYMAPEQWEGEPAGTASDRFALGVLAYLMLTGSRPFENQLDPEGARRSFRAGPAPAHEKAAQNGRPDLPAAVSDVLAKALSQQPDQRYESAREFFSALRQAVVKADSQPAARPTVFISYRRDESAMAARVLATALEGKYGFQVFLDTERVDNVVPFPEELERAVRQADIFICLLGRRTLASRWVNEEIRIACDLGKPMIPVFQESFPEVKPGESFAPHIDILLRHQAVHLLDRRGIYIDPAMEKLAGMIRGPRTGNSKSTGS